MKFGNPITSTLQQLNVFHQLSSAIEYENFCQNLIVEKRIQCLYVTLNLNFLVIRVGVYAMYYNMTTRERHIYLLQILLSIFIFIPVSKLNINY